MSVIGPRALRIVSLAAKAAAVLALVLVVGLGALVVLGPLRLDFLRPRLEAALRSPDGSIHVELGSIELGWAGWKRGVDLRIRDFRAIGSDGNPVASIPALGVRFKVLELLHGRIVLSGVTLERPQVRMVRQPDGRIDLGLGERAEPTPQGTTLPWLPGGSFSTDRGATSTIERLDVDQAQLVLDDRRLGLVLQAPTLDLELRNRADHLAATLATRLALGAQTVSVSVHGSFARKSRQIEGAIEVAGFDPASVAAELRRAQPVSGAEPDPRLTTALAAIDVPLGGNLHITLDDKLTPVKARLDVRGGAGTVAVAAADRPAVPVKRLTLVATLDRAAARLAVEQAAVDLEKASIAAQGKLTLPPAGNSSVDAEANVKNLDVALVPRLWPQGQAEKVRDWIADNIPSGAVPAAKLGLRLEGRGADGLDDLRVVDLRGSFGFRDLAVRYVEGLPAATGVSGTATVSRSGFRFEVNGAAVERINVGPSRVVIDGLLDVPRITVDASVAGPIDNALAILDRPPVMLMRSIAFPPDAVSGELAGDLHLDFPLGGKIGLQELGLAASGHLHNVAAPQILNGWPVEQGEAELSVDSQALAITGAAHVAGTPVELSWRDRLTPAEEPTRTIVASATLDAAGRAALGFDLRPYVEGAIPVKLDLSQAVEGSIHGRLDADLTQATIEVGMLGVRKNAASDGHLQADLSIREAAVAAIERFEHEFPDCNGQENAARKPSR